jgi:pyruvate formate lyase activating enzyme
MSLSAAPPSLAQVLAGLTREGELYDRLPDKAVRCFACGHRCTIPEGRPGVCKVRFNADGVLRVPWGYVGALQCDPIEKKPFFHALPGAQALSFGMLGCDYHCAYCQNWITSQTLRDPEARAEPRELSPRELVGLALERRAPVVASTYNEPLITSEWGVAVFREARRAGLLTAYISNGNGTEQVLDYIQPHIDLYKIDLKSFSDRRYRSLGGTLAAVLRTVESVWRRGIWLEIVTLLVPGFNDSPEEVRDMARFIGGLSRDIPWHLTGFHNDYRMTDRADTDGATLRRCAAIARDEGLRFVYAGNLPGRVGDLEDTRCSACGATLIARRGFHILSCRVSSSGACPDCGAAVPGVWSGEVRHPARAASQGS